MIWLLAVILIPVIVVALLFLSAMDDFAQIITFLLDFRRLIDDLWHVLLILLLGAAAEVFSLVMWLGHLL
ncbi:hypothetical protein [Acidithiobacillus sp. AMEEHan]|uniref:hypothetical protein n=1 Tax=Acidithiobacillus sp. AMEEHan TaxID=2994951 RepID=UPI0027E503BE|nr:hypothetical protein [Acidithiobacillus sp. AMEEHan]